VTCAVDKIDGNSFEWESDPSKHNNFPEDLGAEGGYGNSNRRASAEGSNLGKYSAFASEVDEYVVSNIQ